MAHFLLGAVPLLLAAQVTQSTVVGTVRDGETGEPLPGAVVALSDLHRSTATDATGRYELRDVPAGPQHITVRRLGHTPRTLHALVPRAGQLEINVALEPEPIRLPTLEVRSPVVVRGAEDAQDAAFPDRASSVAAVRNHPQVTEPDALQTLSGGEVVLRPESPSGIHVRGGSSDQTAYLLDGIPVYSPYHTAGVFSAWNPDALSRLHLSAAAPSPDHPHALSGAVSASTRTPGAQIHTQASVSTNQARLTVDGPLGRAGAGYLVSYRADHPGAFAPPDETSYVTGETGDWLGKLEAPALGGRVRLLGYNSHNEIDASAVAEAPGASVPDRLRNVYEWHSFSMGAEWKGTFSGTALRILGWTAAGDASCVWAGEVAGIDLTSSRRDAGLLAVLERSSPRGSTVAGLRLEQSRTSYRIESDSAQGPSLDLSARTPVATAFAQHARQVGNRVGFDVGASLASAGGNLYLGPRAQLRWDRSDQVTLSGHYARTHQFAQSLRNAESVVGNIFPADLYMGARAPGVPVARSSQGVIALSYRPASGIRLGVQAYARGFDGLLLVAPRDGEPFATGTFTDGTGSSRGVSVEASMSSARLGVVLSYGLQRVQLAYGDSSYVPECGATHLLEGGVILFPSATSSIRVGAAGTLGRRTTAVSDEFEWEAQNLLDRGSEFAGSPSHGGEPLGAVALPGYFRIDLGVRKHWHVEVGGRNASIELFGTVTNLLGRKNVLTVARDPATGEQVEIEMRPLAPLVVGLDCRF